MNKSFMYKVSQDEKKAWAFCIIISSFDMQQKKDYNACCHYRAMYASME